MPTVDQIPVPLNRNIQKEAGYTFYSGDHGKAIAQHIFGSASDPNLLGSPARSVNMSSREGSCEQLQRALRECHRRIPSGLGRDSACRHLNLALAQCLVSLACPHESEAVRTLCSSAGTALKRKQCQQAQLSLSICLSSHQQKL